MGNDLDAVWKALSDPTRRSILDSLRKGPLTTTEIVTLHPDLTRFGVMKHLGVLRGAGLVTDRWVGRSRINFLNVVPIRQIYERWVSGYQDLWASKLTSLKHALELEATPPRRKK
jgi:DNA-binding transcriptional ArsR family regulator